MKQVLSRGGVFTALSFGRRNINMCKDNKTMTKEELKQLLKELPDGEIHLIEFVPDDKDGDADEL